MRRAIRALAAACVLAAGTITAFPLRHRAAYTRSCDQYGFHHDRNRYSWKNAWHQRRAVHQRHRHRFLDRQKAGRRHHKRRAGVPPGQLLRLPTRNVARPQLPRRSAISAA